MVFDFERAKGDVAVIRLEKRQVKKRKYPVFRFYNENDDYICEVRYGGRDANALQRGFWTHTKHAYNYFNSITNGWIDYSDNEFLVKLFGYGLISSQDGHKQAIEILQKDIERLKRIKYD